MILLMCCWILFASILLKIFASISSMILVCNFLFWSYLCLVLVSGWWWPHRMSLGVFLPLQFFGRVWEGLQINFFKYWVKFNSEDFWSCAFPHCEIFDYWFYLFTSNLSVFSIFLDSGLVGHMFLRIFPFLLSHPLCWHIIIHSSLLWSFVFLWYQL